MPGVAFNLNNWTDHFWLFSWWLPFSWGPYSAPLKCKWSLANFIMEENIFQEPGHCLLEKQSWRKRLSGPHERIEAKIQCLQLLASTDGLATEGNTWELKNNLTSHWATASHLGSSRIFQVLTPSAFTFTTQCYNSAWIFFINIMLAHATFLCVASKIAQGRVKQMPGPREEGGFLEHLLSTRNCSFA